MYVILWEFTVRSDRRRDFIAAYNTDGLWAQLFRGASGYLGTELLFSDETSRFVTVDRWVSASDFREFQARFCEEYEQLDRQLKGFTLKETKLGSFDVLSG